MIVRIEDMRRAGHCVSGVKRWFEAHGLDFRAFLKDGIDSEILLATGDGLAVRVVRMTEEHRNG